MDMVVGMIERQRQEQEVMLRGIASGELFIWIVASWHLNVFRIIK